jgi:hypothetical protein
MKRALFILAYAVALFGATSAQAQRGPAIPAGEPTTRAPFGCDARAPNVCYFRIFYTRGDRIVILPAAMMDKRVPAVIGGNYCMTLSKAPAYKCTRKVVNANYNS